MEETLRRCQDEVGLVHPICHSNEHDTVVRRPWKTSRILCVIRFNGREEVRNSHDKRYRNTGFLNCFKNRIPIYKPFTKSQRKHRMSNGVC